MHSFALCDLHTQIAKKNTNKQKKQIVKTWKHFMEMCVLMKSSTS